MKRSLALFTSYKSTIAYITCMVLLNILFARIPLMTLWDTEFSPVDWICGVIYLFRDFAQREIQHKVILAMLFGAALSFWLAEADIAVASLCAFLVGESADWAIYTFTRRPLSERLLWSAAISTPVDSIVFLAIVGQLNGLGLLVMTFSKLLGVLMLWAWWRRRVAHHSMLA